jgi:hypothetical protein
MTRPCQAETALEGATVIFLMRAIETLRLVVVFAQMVFYILSFLHVLLLLSAALLPYSIRKTRAMPLEEGVFPRVYRDVRWLLNA